MQGSGFQTGSCSGIFRTIVIDGIDLQQGKVTLTLFGRADLAGDGITGAQVEVKVPDWGRHRCHPDRPGRSFSAGATQEAETVLQYLQNAIPEDVLTAFGVGLENCENNIFLVQTSQVFQARGFTKLDKLGYGGVL